MNYKNGDHSTDRRFFCAPCRNWRSLGRVRAIFWSCSMLSRTFQWRPKDRSLRHLLQRCRTSRNEKLHLVQLAPCDQYPCNDNHFD